VRAREEDERMRRPTLRERPPEGRSLDTPAGTHTLAFDGLRLPRRSVPGRPLAKPPLTRSYAASAPPVEPTRRGSGRGEKSPLSPPAGRPRDEGCLMCPARSRPGTPNLRCRRPHNPSPRSPIHPGPRLGFQRLAINPDGRSPDVGRGGNATASECFSSPRPNTLCPARLLCPATVWDTYALARLMCPAGDRPAVRPGVRAVRASLKMAARRAADGPQSGRATLEVRHVSADASVGR